MPVTIDVARCDGNGACVAACAFGAIEVHDGKAVVYDNCTDCAACVLACAPKAIWSELFSSASAAGALAVAFSARSGIAAVVDRATHAAQSGAAWVCVDPTDAGAAAEAVAAAAKDGGYGLIVLPHDGAGPAIAGRIAAHLGANLLAGCVDLTIDEGGAVRGQRLRFGGIVAAAARAGAGTSVVTLIPRGNARVGAAALETAPSSKAPAGEAPAPPSALARRVVAIDASLTPDARRAALLCAEALGADIVGPASAATSKPLSPDLYVAFGVEGSTEHNAAFRNARVVAAVVSRAEAPIAQIADYLLVGDVEEHAKALAAAL